MKGLIRVAVLLALSAPVSSQDWSGIAARTHGLVLRVVMEDQTGKGYCSGTVINKAKGYVLTAAHCLPLPGGSITVDDRHATLLFEEKDDKRPVANTLIDLAILEVKGLDTTRQVVLIADDHPTVGLPIVVVGHALAAVDPKFTFGWISASTQDGRLESIGAQGLVFSASFVPGQSGGAVLTPSGQLVSIVQRYGQNLGFGATPKQIREFVRDRWGS